MDFDLLSDFLADPKNPIPGTLLSNLPNRSHTAQNAGSEFKDNDSNTNGQLRTSSAPRLTNRNSPGAVISKIEDIFMAMTDCIIGEKKELSIQLKTRNPVQSKSDDRKKSKKEGKSEIKTITFPSQSPQEAWKFSRYDSSSEVGCLLMGDSCFTSNT